MRSASKAETLLRCPASDALPQHNTHSEAADAGTESHALVANVINTVPGAAALLASRYPDMGFKLAEKTAGIDLLTGEAAFVVDLKAATSKFIGKDIDRAYEAKLGRSMSTYEMGASLDLSGITPEGMHWVRDLKFGVHHTWTQLYVQALALLLQPGQHRQDACDVGFLFIDESESGEVTIREESRIVYLFELDVVADEICRAIDRSQSYRGATNPPTAEGEWCKYCAAFPNCPAKWALVRSITSPGLDVPNSIGALAFDQLGDTWRKLGEVERKIIGPAKDAIRHRLKVEGPAPVGDRKALKVIDMPGRDSLDRARVVALLRDLGATQQDINSCFKQGTTYQVVKEVNR